MSVSKRTSKALALLIPTGVVGISAALATMQTDVTEDHPDKPIADRLSEIRQGVSATFQSKPVIGSQAGSDVKLTLAEWLNFGGGWGWHNGGWGNGGWHNWGNGGWGNGGWGNGGWHNWGNGWHNYWHNW